MCECVYQCLMPMSCTGLAVQSGFCIYNAARMNQCKSADRPCCQYYSGDRCVPYVNNSNTVVSGFLESIDHQRSQGWVRSH